MPQLFQVTISNPGSANGFIDHQRIEQYGNLTGVTLPQSIVKRYSNLRQKAIFENVATISNPIISTPVAVGATATSDGSAYTFNVTFDFNHTLHIVRNSIDLYDGDALKTLIAEALIVPQTHTVDIYDPTVGGLVVQTITVPPLVGSVAAGVALITINLSTTIFI